MVYCQPLKDENKERVPGMFPFKKLYYSCLGIYSLIMVRLPSRRQDVRTKISPNSFAKVAPKVIITIFTEKVMFSKKFPHIKATFDRQFVTKNFQKSPIWSRCCLVVIGTDDVL